MPSFPSVDFTNCSISSNTPTLVTKSINGVEERASIAGQYWTVGATFRNLSDSERRQLIGFIMKSRGPYSTFDLTLPDVLNDSSGSWSGSITGSWSANSLTFTIASSTSSITILKAGDFITLQGHNKVYMVTDDCVTSSGGAGTVNVYPAIRSSGSGTVTHKNVVMTVRLATDNIPFSLDQKLFSSVDIDFVEVL